MGAFALLQEPSGFAGRHRRTLDLKKALGRQAGPLGPGLMEDGAQFRKPPQWNVSIHFQEVLGFGNFPQPLFHFPCPGSGAQRHAESLPHLGRGMGLQPLQKKMEL
jgi:hypothetical protein